MTQKTITKSKVSPQQGHAHFDAHFLHACIWLVALAKNFLNSFVEAVRWSLVLKVVKGYVLNTSTTTTTHLCHILDKVVEQSIGIRDHFHINVSTPDTVNIRIYKHVYSEFLVNTSHIQELLSHPGDDFAHVQSSRL